MKKFFVEVPVTMKLMVGVDAESKEEAINKVFDGDISFDATYDKETFDFVDYEWEMHEQIVQGNVFYGITNEVYAEEEEE